MLPFPEQLSWQLAPIPLLPHPESPLGAAPAVVAAVAAPAPPAAAPARTRPAGAEGPTLAPVRALAEPQMVQPPKGALQTAYQVQPFVAACLEFPRNQALPFRRKLSIESATAYARAAAASSDGGVMTAPRPGASVVEDQLAAPSPKLKVQPIRKAEAPAAPAEPAKPKEVKHASIEGPSWGASGEEATGLAGMLARIPLLAKMGMIGAVILVAVLYVVGGNKGTSPEQTSETGPAIQDLAAGQSMAGSGWLTDYAAGAGTSHARQLTLFKQSMTLQNYRMNFTAQVQSRALGWVFRAQDMKNYYAMRLELNAGPNGQAALYKFAVIDGQEGPRLKIPVPFPINTTTAVRIAEVVRGPRFSVYLQNQLLDTWSDTSLKTGGLGFLRERGETANILNVEVLRDATQ